MHAKASVTAVGGDAGARQRIAWTACGGSGGVHTRVAARAARPACRACGSGHQGCEDPARTAPFGVAVPGPLRGGSPDTEHGEATAGILLHPDAGRRAARGSNAAAAAAKGAWLRAAAAPGGPQGASRRRLVPVDSTAEG